MRYRLHLPSLAVLLVVLLAGCGHPLSQASRAESDAMLTTTAVAAQPDAARGRTLVFGGAIVSHAASDSGSLLTILPWRINRWGEPLYPEDSSGHLLVRSAESLDPATCAPGVLVTLAGRVLGHDPASTLPLLELTELHAWDSPFRYGIRGNLDAAEPQYVGGDEGLPRHPYDPGYNTYPFTPYSDRLPGSRRD